MICLSGLGGREGSVPPAPLGSRCVALRMILVDVGWEALAASEIDMDAALHTHTRLNTRLTVFLRRTGAPVVPRRKVGVLQLR